MTQQRRSPENHPLQDEIRPGAQADGEMDSGQLSFEDDEVMSGRGNGARTGGTWNAEGGDSGKLGPPREILSDRNGPSDPDRGPGGKRS